MRAGWMVGLGETSLTGVDRTRVIHSEDDIVKFRSHCAWGELSQLAAPVGRTA